MSRALLNQEDDSFGARSQYVPRPESPRSSKAKAGESRAARPVARWCNGPLHVGQPRDKLLAIHLFGSRDRDPDVLPALQSVARVDENRHVVHIVVHARLLGKFFLFRT